MKNIPIGEVLKEDGYITQSQIDRALENQQKSGKRLGTILVEMGFVSEKQVLEALGKRLNLSFVNLSFSLVSLSISFSKHISILMRFQKFLSNLLLSITSLLCVRMITDFVLL